MSKTSDKKIDKIRDDALRRALSMPPKPKKEKNKSAEKLVFLKPLEVEEALESLLKTKAPKKKKRRGVFFKLSIVE